MTDSFTPTTDANAIPTVIAQEMIRVLPANMGAAKFVSKDNDWSGKDFASYGDTLTIDKPGDVTVKTKTPGTPMVSQNPALSKISVTLNKHVYIDVLHEDITKLLRKPDTQKSYANSMAIKIAEHVEAYLFSLHASVVHTVTFDHSSEATIDTSMRNLRSKFSRLKVPQNEEKVLFADTSLVDRLLSVTKYTSRDYTEGRAIMDGALMKIYNNNIFESQLIPSTGSPVAYHNFAMTKFGMVLVNRPMPLDGNGKGVLQTTMTDPFTGLSFRLTEGYSHGDLGSRFTIDVLFGAALCDTDQVIELESF